MTVYESEPSPSVSAAERQRARWSPAAPDPAGIASSLLAGLGYEALDDVDVSRARGTADGALLLPRLARCLTRLNPGVAAPELEWAARALVPESSFDLVTANECVHRALVHGLARAGIGHREPVSRSIRFIDCGDPAANEYAFARLVPSGGRDAIFADLVVFVNGIPLGVIHAEGGANASVARGIDELLRDQGLSRTFSGAGRSALFATTQVLVAMTAADARYATVGSEPHEWTSWADASPPALSPATPAPEPSPAEALLRGVFTPSTLLDLVGDFVVFEMHGPRRSKMIARRSQYAAVAQAMKRIENARQPAARGGVVWHPHGAGRALTYVFLAKKLARRQKAEGGTLVLVSDREGLHARVKSAFRAARLGSPVRIDEAARLLDVLEQGTAATVLTRTNEIRVATAGRARIAPGKSLYVLFDDPPRPQYSSVLLDLRRTLPDCCVLSITGAPIDEKDRATFTTVGPYVHKYTVEQSTAEHVTVPVLYEPRDLPTCPAPSSPKASAPCSRKQRHGPEERFVQPRSRVEAICRDLLAHFESQVRPRGFKAQIVVRSRQDALAYERQLEALGAPECAVVATPGTASREEVAPREKRGARATVLARFSDPEDPLAILIVCRGSAFCAPVVQVVYLVTSLEKRSLFRALLLPNRRAAGKSAGLIVDYAVGEYANERALSTFTPADLAGVVVLPDRSMEVVSDFGGGAPGDSLESTTGTVFGRVRNPRPLRVHSNGEDHAKSNTGYSRHAHPDLRRVRAR